MTDPEMQGSGRAKEENAGWKYSLLEEYGYRKKKMGMVEKTGERLGRSTCFPHRVHIEAQVLTQNSLFVIYVVNDKIHRRCPPVR